MVGDDPEKFFQVGAKLPLQEKEQLVEFLRENIDVFAWSAYEAPGYRSELHLSSTKCESFHYSEETATSAPIKRACRGCQKCGGQAQVGRGYQGSFLSSMVSQHGGGEKEDWEVASVRRLHGP